VPWARWDRVVPSRLLSGPGEILADDQPWRRVTVRSRKPITGIVGCCARAASGHAAANPATPTMRSRRLMGSPSDRPGTVPHWLHVVHHSKFGCRCLRRVITYPKAALGRGPLSFPIAVIRPSRRHLHFVPQAAVSNRSKAAPYSITSRQPPTRASCSRSPNAPAGESLRQYRHARSAPIQGLSTFSASVTGFNTDLFPAINHSLVTFIASRKYQVTFSLRCAGP
jgi:hypothetical protein